MHTHALGGSENAYKTKPVAIEELDDGFCVKRSHMSAIRRPIICKVISNKTDKIDRRTFGRLMVPGIFLLTRCLRRPASARRRRPGPGARQYRNAHS